MTIKLPPLMTAFIKAKNSYDITAFVACFADNAVVHDEGQEMRGTDAIRKWIEASNEKYKDTLCATGLTERGNQIILTALVSGNFDGSPISLDFYFTVNDSKITMLSIQLAGE